jgi:hypothetical protein
MKEISRSDCAESNKKTVNIPMGTMSDSSGFQSEGTNAEKNNQQIAKNGIVEHCNQTIIAKMANQVGVLHFISYI